MFKFKMFASLLSLTVILSLCIYLNTPRKVFSVDVENTTEKAEMTVIQQIENKVEREKTYINVNVNGDIRKTELEDYITCVVAGEVSPTYSEEALKAQAVAARTYLIYKKENGGCANGGDICTDYKHCQAYKNYTDMQSQWGNKYETYLTAIRNAVDETSGEILIYEDMPICALYHSSSVGRTEDCVSVFGGNRPYLVSVTSPLNSSDSEYTKDVTFTKEEFLSKIRNSFSDISIDGFDIKIISYTDAGRVSTVKIGDKTVKATALRTALSLRSTDFTFKTENGKITFTQRGYGHGVGMSQHGAQSLAESGKNYREILLHYYTGCEIKTL